MTSPWCALLWNCNSLSSLKFNQLSILSAPVSSSHHPLLPSRPTFIALTETKRASAPPLTGYSSFSLPAVTYLSHGRGMVASGGIALYVRNTIPCTLTQHLRLASCPYVLFVTVALPGSIATLVAVVYHRSSDPDSMPSIISRCRENLPQSPLHQR
jgi:hypothetical protein